MALAATSTSFKKTSRKPNAYTLPEISYSLLADESVKWQDKVPVGVKFNPNDQVLVVYYLAGKVNGCTDGPIFPLIKEVDVFQHEPSQLSRLSYNFGHEKMYFFTRLNKKSEMEMNVDRRVPGGVWKKTREPSYVKGKDGKPKPIAIKTTLGYYKNDLMSKKAQWFMKEYMLLDSQLILKQNNYEESWRLCVVYYSREHNDSEKKWDYDEENNISCDSSEDSTSDMSSSDSEKHYEDETIL